MCEQRHNTQGNIIVLFLNLVLPHLETLVQNCGRCEQTAEHVTEDAYSCVHHQERHKVAGKLPESQTGRGKV
jgi:hypothetical protein